MIKMCLTRKAALVKAQAAHPGETSSKPRHGNAGFQASPGSPAYGLSCQGAGAKAQSPCYWPLQTAAGHPLSDACWAVAKPGYSLSVS